MAKDKNAKKTLEEMPEPNNETAEVEQKDSGEELENQKEQYLRLAAEYDNFRKRSAKERESLTRIVKCDTIAELLPVVDNLCRALNSDASGDDLRKGLELTMQQLNACFEKLGVTAFGEPGEPFDPNLHDAMQHIESENFGESTISSVFQQGYKIGDSVIRHAAVIVAN